MKSLKAEIVVTVIPNHWAYYLSTNKNIDWTHRIQLLVPQLWSKSRFGMVNQHSEVTLNRSFPPCSSLSPCLSLLFSKGATYDLKLSGITTCGSEDIDVSVSWVILIQLCS